MKKEKVNFYLDNALALLGMNTLHSQQHHIKQRREYFQNTYRGTNKVVQLQEKITDKESPKQDTWCCYEILTFILLSKIN